MSISILEHPQSIKGYQHHSFEYKAGILTAVISKKNYGPAEVYFSNKNAPAKMSRLQ